MQKSNWSMDRPKVFDDLLHVRMIKKEMFDYYFYGVNNIPKCTRFVAKITALVKNSTTWKTFEKKCFNLFKIHSFGSETNRVNI